MTSSGDLPFVSVLMPVRNEAIYIERSLGAVAAQTWPRERTEVLVIDGLSDDGTRDRVREIARRHPEVEIRLLDNPGRTAPCALNVGLARARGEIVARVDGHCEIAPDYLANGVRHLREDGVDAVGGPLETVGETPTAAAIALAMSSPFGVGGSAFRTDRGIRARLVDTVAFPLYTREAVERAGPFDEELVRNQDDEYNYRLRKLGGRVLLCPDLKARYYSRSGFTSLWRQFFQFGLYKVRVLRKHPRQMQGRQLVPPLFVLALLVSTLAAPWIVAGRVILASVAGSYLVAVSAAAAWSARRTGRHPPAPPLPAVPSPDRERGAAEDSMRDHGEFRRPLSRMGGREDGRGGWGARVGRVVLAMAILHFAYGSGFLKGLLFLGILRRPESG